MWPFKKKNANIERTPWDDLADYLASSDIKFDMNSSIANIITILYKNKSLRMDVHSDYDGYRFSNLYHNDVHLNDFLGKRYHKVCANVYRQYEILRKKNIENKLYCDLFDKCNES